MHIEKCAGETQVRRDPQAEPSSAMKATNKTRKQATPEANRELAAIARSSNSNTSVQSSTA
jgi:hypothetical protein